MDIRQRLNKRIAKLIRLNDSIPYTNPALRNRIQRRILFLMEEVRTAKFAVAACFLT